MQSSNLVADAVPQAQAAVASCFDPEAWRRDRASLRRKVAVLVGALLVACALSLGIGVTTHELYGPQEVLNACGTWFYTTFMHLFQGKNYTTVDIQALSPCYYQVLNRLGITFMAVLCGALLTISGMIYQSVFRNPIAAPTMLGVASGLNIGLLAFVWAYGSAALYATAPHYLYAYGGALAVLIVVLVLSRLVNGKRWFSVVDMLLVGSIISQALGAVVLYVSYYVFDDAQWLVYTTVNEVLTVVTDPLAYVFLIVAFVVSFVPVYVLRFRLNALSFTPAEARGFGVDLYRMRYAALFFATVMVIAAMAHAGMVGMAALVVPFVSRALFGAEARKQLVGNILIGALLLVVCRGVADLLSTLLWSVGFTFAFPVGIVATLLCLPAFVWIMALQQRAWE